MSQNYDEPEQSASPPPSAIKKGAIRIRNCVLSPQALLVLGIGASAAFILEGILCFTLCTTNVRSYILSFYYLIFGLITIGAEVKLGHIVVWFRIIATYSGRGIWYVFLGSLALGPEWWALLIALFLFVVAAFNLVASCSDTPNGADSYDVRQQNKALQKQHEEYQAQLDNAAANPGALAQSDYANEYESATASGDKELHSEFQQVPSASGTTEDGNKTKKKKGLFGKMSKKSKHGSKLSGNDREDSLQGVERDPADHVENPFEARNDNDNPGNDNPFLAVPTHGSDGDGVNLEIEEEGSERAEGRQKGGNALGSGSAYDDY